MGKRIIIFLLSWIAVAGMAFAQGSATKEINSIKRNNQYIYAEATMDTEEEAYQIAQDLLATYINEYIESKKKLNKADNVIVKDISGKSEKIKMMRGEMYRVFVYVKKNDLIPADNVVTFVKAEVPQETAPVAEDVPSENVTSDETLKLSVAWQQAVIDELLSVSSLTEAKALLNRLKAEYKVKRYGNYSECKNPAECFWLITDANGFVQAVLGPGAEERTNFKLLQYDSLKNYSGSNAIWFTLSK